MPPGKAGSMISILAACASIAVALGKRAIHSSVVKLSPFTRVRSI
jgi:hypothetical protein